jgi:uncharacterized protein (TIGR00730 family)
VWSKDAFRCGDCGANCPAPLGLGAGFGYEPDMTKAKKPPAVEKSAAPTSQPTPPNPIPVAPLASHKGANSEQIASPTYRLAALDQDYLLSDSMRGVRFMLEYNKAEEALDRWGVRSTVVVFGSARFSDKGPPNHQRWYNDARTFARIVSERGGALKKNHRRDNVVATGGGPGIMEAANRGAADVGAPSIGYNITLPMEQEPNAYSTPDLTLRFHYFAMRKMHFAMRANALVVFPGGLGTLDELFELLALRQTGKAPPLPIVLYDEKFWRDIADFDAMVKYGVISAADLDLFSYAETPEEAWRRLVDGGVLTKWLQEQHTT